MNIFNKAYYERPLLFGTNATDELLYVIDKYNISGHALELGCGDGRDTKHILDRGFSICAVEQSKYALDTLYNRKDISEEKKNLLSLVNDNVLNFVYHKEEYDFVYAITLFDHLSEDECGELINKVIPSIKKGGYLFVKVHSVDDVGNTNQQMGKSEFSSEIKHYFKHNELLMLLLSKGQVIYYLESQEDDFDHGAPHKHSFASILIKKENI